MRIESARRQGNMLCLQTSDPAAWRWLIQFKPGEYEIKKEGKKRSLTANSYAWVLIDKIAAETRLDRTEVYKNALMEIGGVSKIVCVQENAADELERVWRANGMGWQTERIPIKTKGCVGIRLIYGSSAYNTKQMSALIDKLVQDAKSLDIETMPPEKLASLLGEWDAKQKQ